MHALRKEYASEGEGDRSDYERSQKMTDAKKKIEGIGPITKDGMPVALRSVSTRSMILHKYRICIFLY